MSTIGFELYSLSDLRAPQMLAGVGRAFDADPQLRPERMDVRDPIRTRIDSAADYLTGAASLIDTENVFFERRSDPPLSGILSAPSYRDADLKDSPHHIYADLDDADEWLGDAAHVEAFAQLFVRLAGAFEATYGFATDSRMPRQQSGEFARMRQRRQYAPAAPDEHSDRHSVRDVYWLNYFGPAYLERWGKRLDGLGVRQERTANGGLVIWAVDSPFAYAENVGSFMAYPWKRPFYETLGRDTFVNALGASWDQRVPTRDDHLRHATVRETVARTRKPDPAPQAPVAAAPASPPAAPHAPKPAAPPVTPVSKRPPAAEWLVAVVGDLRRLGFFRSYPGDAYAAAEVAAAFKSRHRREPRPNDHEDELLLAKLDESRVWWEDTEGRVAIDKDAYVAVVAGWARVSRGSFAPNGVREEWLGPEGPVAVHLLLGETTHVLTLRYLEDSLDMGLLDQINALIEDEEFSLRMHAAFDQTALVVAVDAREFEGLRERGWSFAL